MVKVASLLVFGTLCCVPHNGVFGFAPLSPAKSAESASVRLFADNSNDSSNDGNGMNRRQALLGGLLVAASALTASAPPAQATYTAYTRREQDWQERLDKKEITVSSARDLRRQLQEVAPMNSAKSQLFCPNGPSAAVSPLMENKCGDRMAIPSVYGRTTDAVGNSIPGFEGGKYESGMLSSLSAESVGGYPNYGFTK